MSLREKWQIRDPLTETLQNMNLTDFNKETERFNWTHENLRHLISFEQLRVLAARIKELLELYILPILLLLSFNAFLFSRRFL